MGTSVAVVKVAALFQLAQLAQVLFLFYALVPELSRRDALSSLLKGLAVGLIVQGGYVIYQKLTGVVQASGTVTHQNILGIIVQMSALPLIAAVMEGERSKLMYVGILAACVCIAGGGSRASIGFFALGLGVLVLLSLIRRATPRKWSILGLGAAAAVVLVPLTLQTLQQRFGDGPIATEEDGRAAFERAAKAMSSDYPFGVGPNNFVGVNNTGGYAAEAGLEWGGGLLDKPVHNAYLLARAEMGWLGQIALILLFGGVATRAFLTGFDRQAPAIAGIALGSATGITTMAIHSNFEFAWFTLEPQRLFFVNAAIVAGLMTLAARERAARREGLRGGKDDAIIGPMPRPATGPRVRVPGGYARPQSHPATAGTKKMQE